MVAFGPYFLANPNLIYRSKHGLKLNKYMRPIFYLAKKEEGYNDYSFSEEFLAEY
jgi:NADPH2 dehydrogenase